MKKICIFILVIVFPLFFHSCKTAEKNKENTTKVMGSDTATSYPDQTAELQSRFKVSFISKGSGIDRKMKEKYDQYIENFEKENKVKLNNEVIRWGKEGETNYCFDLSNLNQTKKEKFISESKDLLKTSSIIFIDEHAMCH